MSGPMRAITSGRVEVHHATAAVSASPAAIQA